ncbi:Disease resistance protein L6 [Linum perenne]
MDQQRFLFIWPLAALSLAVAVFFLPKRRPGISNGTSPSQSESPVENQPSTASTSSNSALPVEYEVFLSFRGPDVRANFADVLYKFLDRFKIRTFLDNEELPKGETIAPSLEKAIKESKVYVPILSQDYASSKWCLQELALMVKCCKQGDDRIILPIFYMMEPRDVRHQEGSYKKAFQLHSKKYDAETIKEWKEALKEVGEMKGWSVKESDRRSHLMRSYKLVTEDLVGIDSHVQQVTTLLSLESGSVKIVGIHAMGGMGKTTIAKAVYDQLYSQFDRFCFVEDAREILSKSDGVVTLQNKIISSILITDYKVKDASEGLRVINDRVCKYKVLVVLDDVNDLFEFDQTLGKLDNFSHESRFIFTTRDKRVLQILQGCMFYEPAEMKSDHALQLFSKHAFGTNVPPTDYATLSLEFVQVATGLPLALKVIGSLLFRREREFWAAKLMELKDIPPTRLQERLKLSYNELSDNEKQIFLDIACFFIDREKDFPFYMWSDCKFYPESGINTLLLRSLIRFNERNEFWMHDHIRDLGRKIVREEDSQRSWKRSRIWSNEDALDILRNGQGSDRVEVLRVDVEDENFELTDKEFKKLSRLRYLEVCYGRFIGDFNGVLPNLRWLRLNGCTLIPNDLNMKKLVILEMIYCPVEDEWRGWSGIKVASNLKAIHLQHCDSIITAPDLSQCRNLEWIDLHDCLRMSGEIHIGNLLNNLKLLSFSETNTTKLTGDIGALQNLQVFHAGNLREFRRVMNLPTSLNQLSLSSSRVLNLSELKDLEELCFDYCDELQYLGGLWKLSKLRKLQLKYLSSCNSLLVEGDDVSSTGFPLPSSLNFLEISDLESLPNFANLNNLTELTLSRFQMPEIQGLGDLIMLQTLKIPYALNLINLDGLESLSHLKTLNLEDCLVLEKLPISLVNLTKLQELSIKRCRQLAEVMGLERLEALRNLETLDISRCTGLTEVMGFELNMSGCSSVEELPHLSGLRNIVRLDTSECNQLKEVRGIESLELLEYLFMTNCTSIKKLPDLYVLTNLKTLEISGCTGLTEVMEFGRLESLTELNMSGCSSVEELPDLSGLRNVDELNISGCSSVEELPNLPGSRNIFSLDISECNQLKEFTGVKNLEQLKDLKMRNCTLITKLPDLSVLANLKTLDISGCVQLAEVSGIERLGSLKRLNMSDCSSVEELPDLSCLLNIVSLDISKCNQLKEVMGIKSLELLEDLVMTNCTSIKKLPDLSGCKKLWCLNISGCVQLAEVSGIERLESLKYLNMSGCSSVEELPDLSGLGKIESLDISECNQLKEVTGIESLELLEYLVMTNCTSIEKLPDLSCCKKLWFLDIKGCVQLDEDSGIDKLEGIIVVHSTHSPSISESDDEKGGK